MTPCQRLLDIGAGTGVAALFGATRYAGQAWAVDITDRATRVAEFNARLNGLDNVTCLTGDVYAPVAGMTFDRIVSHPPYMPDREDPLVFRDGGEDGEQVTRRIIAGLADHLEPGGRFQCRFMATDRKDAPLEERVRAMIGPAEAEFDVALITRVTMQVVPFYGQILASGDLSAAQFEGLVRRFERLDVEHMVIGLLTIDRHATPQRSLTLRRPLAAGAQPDPAAVDWAIRWERSTEDAGFADRLSGMRPHIAPAAELSLTHRMTAGELRAVDCTARTKSPFTFSFSGSPGIALLLGRCDGTLTVSDLRAELVEIGVVPADAPPADFLQLIRNLISGGLLEVAEHPLPAPA